MPGILDRQCTTLEQFVAQAQPLGFGTRDEMLLEEWFKWPPDVFALTSLLLSATGAYRRAAAPVLGEWPRSEWVSTAQDLAHDWRNWVASEGQGPHPLGKYIKNFYRHRKLHLDHLYDPELREKEKAPAWELCKLLLELHGIADETMRGAGIVFSPSISLGDGRIEKKAIPPGNLSLFYLQANFLLALRGSLSRLPKYRGIVLPKARTPQVGLTLRSFSNNLTFHQTEVDIAWRAFPWLNADENTVNMMIVPWPFKVNAKFFNPIYHPRAQSHVGRARYFHYEPRPEKALAVDDLIRSLKATINDEVRRIHVMVFPEMALRRADLRHLKRRLEACLRPDQIPMIISGVSARFEDEDNGNESQELDPQTEHNIQVGKDAAGFNRVVLSLYYAGKWHDVVQDKHHRWKIDDSQIEQYQLGGVLSGGRTWWEAIQITRRRLSVLAANSWLIICPLICEDLARLDPVSEVLRGVAPTLLTALLLDGPQLKERWSARYASVFADDPGSSVLTITSLGMSQRSIPPGAENRSDSEKKECADKGRIVGLWKDQEKGWRSIVANESDFPVEVLTISAKWKNESTFDGRMDHENAAVFAYQGDFSAAKGNPGQELETHGEMDIDREEERQRQGTDREHKREDAQSKKLKILDMCELTLFTYYTDAVVEPGADPVALWNWFESAIPQRSPEKERRQQGPAPRLRDDIAEILWYSVWTRDLVPREVPTPHLRFAIRCVGSVVVKARRQFLSTHQESDLATDEGRLAFLAILKNTAWRQVGSLCERMRADLSAPEGEGQLERLAIRLSQIQKRRLRELDRRAYAGKRERLLVTFSPHEIGRLKMMIPISVLWAIHSRLTTMRRLGTLNPAGGRLLEEIETLVSGEAFHGVYLDWRHRVKLLFRKLSKQG